MSCRSPRRDTLTSLTDDFPYAVSASMSDLTFPFTALADLASARVGGRAIGASDDFFAPKSNLLKPDPPIFIPGKFTARGKWMDGWESRRRRTPGHDWCVIALGIRGRVAGVDVDTRHFTGNHPSHCSIDAIDAIDANRPTGARGAPRSTVWAAEGAPWIPLLSKVALEGNSQNLFAISSDRPWTHLRLNIFPDGGVARLRVYGTAAVDWTRLARAKTPVDLASILNGGLVVGASDMHFGARGNLIMPGRARNMGDGWETRRRRGPGYDWAIVRLGTAGLVTHVEIDTNHFKGNYPESASLEGCLASSGADTLAEADWRELIRRTPLRPHHRHKFARELASIGPVSHVRLNIFPDGGVSRLRVHGTVAKA
jgi:allantoicase